ncbi:MAG: 4-hydroxy-3-methylbut-2-en-1-yl diphosphate synthase (flavodoxin) [candidate division WS2 bacterium]|uniref:4-hydroxy-3-methylbut-2-en-1-yl diphosphate synthase (Flavodoxin) n=1 Tax=Psychracetigena formicireducens TaxID=2986056 RepID=A0A9E2BET4_PSYF1|nr:4-hydroxy-3-methylbut-2-en-1-yl diphosphate synthase (flavodoxin) [Candidatus Psychracetigena formicireducens]MBT9144301.1 4-hydroxy-3-methylbut-2-en-1-yl diphosphate synthase (flavodoxin) [Candidatus Psychracetigena formicireducens]
MIFIPEKYTRTIKLGNLIIGGNFPVLIETMSRVSLLKKNEFLQEYAEIEQAGADILRVAVRCSEEAEAFGVIKNNISLPVIADIHKDYQLGVLSAQKGFSMIRVNPGNTSAKGLQNIALASVDYNVAIRVGLNTGSLVLRNIEVIPIIEQELMKTLDIFETSGQKNLMISAKDSHVESNIIINEKISSMTDYPLHIGLTEAGLGLSGIVKSSISIGNLLFKGIGNTIRVSLTDGPVKEVKVAKAILNNITKQVKGLNLISCPGCSRTRIDVLKLATLVNELIGDLGENYTLAVMGCEINGPGEAKGADIGLYGSPEGIVVSLKGVFQGIKTQDETLKWLSSFLKKKLQ